MIKYVGISFPFNFKTFHYCVLSQKPIVKWLSFVGVVHAQYLGDFYTISLKKKPLKLQKFDSGLKQDNLLCMQIMICLQTPYIDIKIRK